MSSMSPMLGVAEGGTGLARGVEQRDGAPRAAMGGGGDGARSR